MRCTVWIGFSIWSILFGFMDPTSVRAQQQNLTYTLLKITRGFGELIIRSALALPSNSEQSRENNDNAITSEKQRVVLGSICTRRSSVVETSQTPNSHKFFIYWFHTRTTCRPRDSFPLSWPLFTYQNDRPGWRTLLSPIQSQWGT